MARINLVHIQQHPNLFYQIAQAVIQILS